VANNIACLIKRERDIFSRKKKNNTRWATQPVLLLTPSLFRQHFVLLPRQHLYHGLATYSQREHRQSVVFKDSKEEGSKAGERLPLSSKRSQQQQQQQQQQPEQQQQQVRKDVNKDVHKQRKEQQADNPERVGQRVFGEKNKSGIPGVFLIFPSHAHTSD